MADPFGGRIPVCLQCRSRRVHAQTLQEGLFPGGGEGTWACDACGYLGQPLLVDPRDVTQEKTEASSIRAREASNEIPSPAPDRILGLFLVAVAAVFLMVTLIFSYGIATAGGIAHGLGALGAAGVSAAFAWVFGKTGWRRLRPN